MLTSGRSENGFKHVFRVSSTLLFILTSGLPSYNFSNEFDLGNCNGLGYD